MFEFLSWLPAAFLTLIILIAVMAAVDRKKGIPRNRCFIAASSTMFAGTMTALWVHTQFESAPPAGVVAFIVAALSPLALVALVAICAGDAVTTRQQVAKRHEERRRDCDTQLLDY